MSQNISTVRTQSQIGAAPRELLKSELDQAYHVPVRKWWQERQHKILILEGSVSINLG